jgi:hypothetical protein
VKCGVVLIVLSKFKLSKGRYIPNAYNRMEMSGMYAFLGDAMLEVMRSHGKWKLH